MRLVKPSIQFLNVTPNALQVIERAGRTCYKPESRIGLITCDTCKGTGKEGKLQKFDCAICHGKGEVHTSELFVRKLLRNGHLAMIEHAWASYKVICDRGVTHEIVRHRLFSYAQESTCYCNYKGGVTFVIPPWMSNTQPGEYKTMGDICDLVGYSPASYEVQWLKFLAGCERMYQEALKKNWTPQQAHSVLPNALKTEIVITGNLRQWLHFLTLRTAKTAHPQMQEVAKMLVEDISQTVPIIFDSLCSE